MGTIQIKKVERTVTTGKQVEERQKVKKTYGKIIFHRKKAPRIGRIEGLTCLVYRMESVKSHKHLEAAVDTREAHEGKAQQAGRKHHNGHAAHAFGDIDQLQLLTHTGKDRQRQAEADGRREGIDHTLQQVEVFLNTKDSHTEHGAVGGNERQEDAQRLIQGGRDLLEYNLYHLHQGGNDEDEGYGLQVLQSVGFEDVFLDQPRDDGGQRHHKGYCCRHTQRGIDLLGNAQERTNAEELRQDDIVDEYRANENQNIFHNTFVLSRIS